MSLIPAKIREREKSSVNRDLEERCQKGVYFEGVREIASTVCPQPKTTGWNDLLNSSHLRCGQTVEAISRTPRLFWYSVIVGLILWIFSLSSRSRDPLTAFRSVSTLSRPRRPSISGLPERALASAPFRAFFGILIFRD